MTPLEIHPIRRIDWPRLRELMAGYSSTQRYAVRREESQAQAVITLTLETLAQPYHKDYGDCLNDEDRRRYEGYLAAGFSLGAYLDGQWVGVALAEAQRWNGVLLVWEFHIHPAQRRQGIGRRQMEALAECASTAGLRALTVETQNTNVGAIRFYRSVGFTLESVDLSLYGNHDVEEGEVALILRRKLT